MSRKTVGVRPSNRTFRPGLEPLETRFALTCFAQFIPKANFLFVGCEGQDNFAILTTEQGRFIRFNGEPIQGDPTVDNTFFVLVNGAPDPNWIDLSGMTNYRGLTLLLGGDGADVILGSPVGDMITAGAGDDFAFGLDGNDTIEGNSGNDYLEGGEGHDRLFLGDRRGSGPGPGGETTEYAFGGCGDDHLVGDLNGMSADYLEGGCGNDTLEGLGLNDTLLGNEGNDWLYGGSGNDYLDGGEDNDWLYGDEGDDTLIGGPGRDHLRGGDGYDRYRDDGEDEWDAECEEPF